MMLRSMLRATFVGKTTMVFAALSSSSSHFNPSCVIPTSQPAMRFMRYRSAKPSSACHITFPSITSSSGQMASQTSSSSLAILPNWHLLLHLLVHQASLSPVELLLPYIVEELPLEGLLSLEYHKDLNRYFQRLVNFLL